MHRVDIVGVFYFFFIFIFVCLGFLSSFVHTFSVRFGIFVSLFVEDRLNVLLLLLLLLSLYGYVHKLDWAFGLVFLLPACQYILIDSLIQIPTTAARLTAACLYLAWDVLTLRVTKLRGLTCIRPFSTI